MELSKITYNQDGNQIIAESKDGGSQTQTIKFGMIKLIGEKNERRISFKTLLAIEEARQKQFTGTIQIVELNMSVSANQIVMARSETENVRKYLNYTNLPTANILLDEFFNITPHSKVWFMQEQKPYYEARVHYYDEDGERKYILDKDKIRLLIEVGIEDGYHIIKNITEYGEKK